MRRKIKSALLLVSIPVLGQATEDIRERFYEKEGKLEKLSRIQNSIMNGFGSAFPLFCFSTFAYLHMGRFMEGSNAGDVVGSLATGYLGGISALSGIGGGFLAAFNTYYNEFLGGASFLGYLPSKFLERRINS